MMACALQEHLGHNTMLNKEADILMSTVTLVQLAVAPA